MYGEIQNEHLFFLDRPKNDQKKNLSALNRLIAENPIGRTAQKRKSLKIKRCHKKPKHEDLQVCEEERVREPDQDIQTFIRKHWSSIRTFSQKG